jgi:beta-phosphoglucomutase-like phosphatase (HAD superfamily)
VTSGLVRAGVIAGKAAGMQVVAVPSLPLKRDRPLYALADVIISSLLDLEPENWGFPPFQDRKSVSCTHY